MKYILIIFAFVLVLGCQKEYLEKKPSKSLLVPETMDDFQALLDNTFLMNRVSLISEIATDDMTTNDQGLQAYLLAGERNSYIWASDIFEGAASSDWDIPYTQIFTANVVLEGIEKSLSIDSDDHKTKAIKAAALFYRAFAHYLLTQQFTSVYEPSKAAAEPGVPLRKTADINVKAGRASLQETYRFILNDLLTAKELLPEQQVQKTRPSRQAAFALLARIYLSMSDFPNALDYADKALALNSSLIDFNVQTPYVAIGNSEVIFNCGTVTAYSFVNSNLTGCSPELYESYATNDFRKTLFWINWGSGAMNFRGAYSQNLGRFMGLAIDELYLIKAECLARTGDYHGGLSVLNELMKKRTDKNSFVPFTAANKNEALKIILVERRKELVCRGLRWTDLRRLNREPEFSKTLVRTALGTTHTLPPEDARYVFPIPDNEINGNGIEQNKR